MEKHGGQDIYDNFDELIEDFSVTTNYLGPNKKGLDHMKRNCHLIRAWRIS